MMCKNSGEKSFYKMFWIDYLVKNDVRKTIRHGFILYMAVAMLAVPSGLCSQQHLVMSFKIPTVNLCADLSAMPNDPAQTRLEKGCPAGRIEDVALIPTLIPMVDTTVMKKNVSPFHEHIMQAAETYEIDPALIKAVILAESSYNPQAVSKRGAQGLMQLMPNTAKSLGVEDSFDPAMNIDGGVRYLRHLLDRFNGDVRLALAAYNAGSRYVRKYRGVPPFRATRQYIKKVLKYQHKFQSETRAMLDIEPAV